MRSLGCHKVSIPFPLVVLPGSHCMGTGSGGLTIVRAGEYKCGSAQLVEQLMWWERLSV